MSGSDKTAARRAPWSGRRTRQLCVTCDAETFAEIDDAARNAGQTRSEWIRERLEWALMEVPA